MDTKLYKLVNDSLSIANISDLSDRFFTSFINLPVLEILNSILTKNDIGEIIIEKVKLRFPIPKMSKAFRKLPENIWSQAMSINNINIDDFIDSGEQEEYEEEDYFEVIINAQKYKDFKAINELLLSPLNSPIVIKDSQGSPLNLNLTHQFPLFWFEKYILKLS